VYPAFYWDDGFPTQYIFGPPQVSPSLLNGTGARGVRPDDLDLPRYQNLSFTYQRQLSANTQFEISYVGNHGTRLPIHPNMLGYPLENMNNPSVLSLGTAALSATVGSAAAEALPVVQAMPVDPATGHHSPYAGFEAQYFPGVPNVAQMLRPFPQYSSIFWRGGFPGGKSVYHSVQTQVERRFSNGLQFRVAYVWSRLKGNGAENGLIWDAPIQNPINRAGEYGLSADDVPHTVIVAYTYALPFGKGKRYGTDVSGAADQVIGGWHVSAIQRYNSGRPITVVMDNDMGGYIYNTVKYPNKLGGGGWSGGNFDPAVDRIVDYSGWADPGPFTFGNAQRTDPDIRILPVYNEDFNLFKDFRIKGEGVKLRFEAQFGNAFNRTLPGFGLAGNTRNSQNWSSANFGKLTTQLNQPRHIQFGLKLSW
jgi:hypothetical protein